MIRIQTVQQRGWLREIHRQKKRQTNRQTKQSGHWRTKSSGGIRTGGKRQTVSRMTDGWFGKDSQTDDRSTAGRQIERPTDRHKCPVVGARRVQGAETLVCYIKS